LHLIKYRKKPNVYIYTRVWYVLYVFLFFKKIGLTKNKIFFESHKFSKFLLKPLSKIDGLVVINNYLGSLYKEQNIKNFFVAHDGVNIDEYEYINNYKFTPNKEEYTVVYTGSLFSWKGVNTLVDSLKYLPENIKLVCIGGSGQYLADFKGYVQSNSEFERITIIPHVPKIELMNYIEQADVLVLPNSAKDKMSLYTSPIKMFEYMASNRPVVASSLPSIKEVLVDMDNAILFEPDSPLDLANKIQYVLDNDCTLITKKALVDVQEYAWDKRANNIAKFMSS
jgi:glycosyltransferase involved in cell wall biosynthesis